MPPARETHRRIGPNTLWVTLAVAVTVHSIALAVFLAFDVRLMSHDVTASAANGETLAVVEEPELKPTCSGDVILATAGRAAMCLAPWRGDAEQCGRDVEMSLWFDLSGCMAQNEPNTAIAMLSPRSIDKLKAIDPEKLMDEMQDKLNAPVPPPPQLAAVTPPPPPPQPAPTRQQQIVETAKPNTEQEPDNARFLAEHNTKVEKEKVARGARNEPMVAKSKPEELKAKDKPPEEDPSVKETPKDRQPGKDERAPDAKTSTLAMRKPGAPSPAETPQEEKVRGSTGGAKGPTIADGYVPRKGDGAVEQQRRERDEQPRGQNGGGGGTPQVPNLRPSKEQLERSLGGGNVDHLEDVDNGDETSLTAKRFVYASFFNRLKRAVAQNWEPAGVWRRADPDGTVYGFKTRVTEVRVSLAPNGQLAKIVVTQPCGVSDLDEEAVRAFRSATPFPNPPEGLVKDGLITFAFSFHFAIGQPRSAWKVLRSN